MEEVKREREVARRIGFDRLYLAEQPEDDNINIDTGTHLSRKEPERRLYLEK
jgi:hypothetical protein